MTSLLTNFCWWMWLLCLWSSVFHCLTVLFNRWSAPWIMMSELDRCKKYHVLSRKDESSFMRLSVEKGFPFQTKTSLNFWANIFRGAGVRQMHYVSKSGSNWGCSENPILFLSWSMVTYIMSYQSQFPKKASHIRMNHPDLHVIFGSNWPFLSLSASKMMNWKPFPAGCWDSNSLKP